MDLEKCWRLPVEVRHHKLTQKFGYAWMPNWKMWGWKWRTEVAQVQLFRRYRRRGKWPYTCLRMTYQRSDTAGGQ
jgi:hypothetical protein